MNVIYSIYIDIDEKNLDNPGWWENGVQIKTNKSLETKLAFLRNYEKLNQVKKDYAENIGADYILFENDNQYKNYFKSFKKNYPQISEYDVVNFYKQWLMLKMAEKYDNVCYLDFDVIPNTKEDIFKAHKIDTHFACAENNSLAVGGKIIDSNRAYLNVKKTRYRESDPKKYTFIIYDFARTLPIYYSYKQNFLCRTFFTSPIG